MPGSPAAARFSTTPLRPLIAVALQPKRPILAVPLPAGPPPGPFDGVRWSRVGWQVVGAAISAGSLYWGVNKFTAAAPSTPDTAPGTPTQSAGESALSAWWQHWRDVLSPPPQPGQ